MRCLEKDPQCRATVDELLEHPWLKTMNKESDQEEEANFDELVKISQNLDKLADQTDFQIGLINFLVGLRD